jgi:transcriptional regulator with XRE-family HTH domain
MASLGEAIEWAYKFAGLKQTGLARCLGVTQTAVSDWKLGRYEPAPSTIAAIEDCCGLPRGAVFVRAGLVGLLAAIDHSDLPSDRKRVLRREAGLVEPDMSRPDVQEIMGLKHLPLATRLRLVAELQDGGQEDNPGSETEPIAG